MHEEEVLGKAYDARLMRRLLKYLRPYRRHVALGILLSILTSAIADQISSLAHQRGGRAPNMETE